MESQRLVTGLKRRAVESCEAPATIHAKMLKSTSTPVLAAFPSKNATKLVIKRLRHEENALRVEPLNLEQLEIPNSYRIYKHTEIDEEQFLLADNGVFQIQDRNGPVASGRLRLAICVWASCVSGQLRLGQLRLASCVLVLKGPPQKWEHNQIIETNKNSNMKEGAFPSRRFWNVYRAEPRRTTAVCLRGIFSHFFNFEFSFLPAFFRKLGFRNEVHLRDGTFASAPALFLQLYVILARRGKWVFPVLHCLLTCKSQSMYEKMFDMVRNRWPTFSPTNASMDFEQAMIFVQVMLISAMNLFGSSLYVFFQSHEVDQWMITLAEFNWLHLHDCRLLYMKLFNRNRIGHIGGVTVVRPILNQTN
ncbi:hypothetical protein niasHT_038920 [Heterodera trifolii]|uniref:Uncharacterized protein n=1 Tax=Heterodera trifolii TaxID=157864 RepID=A0ABD2IWA2_9BILA